MAPNNASLDLPTREDYLASLTDCAPENAECGICLLSLDNGQQVVSLHKTHVFHRACITTWLTEKTTCPMCRIALFSDPDPFAADPVDEPLESVEIQDVVMHDDDAPEAVTEAQTRDSELLKSFDALALADMNGRPGYETNIQAFLTIARIRIEAYRQDRVAAANFTNGVYLPILPPTRVFPRQVVRIEHTRVQETLDRAFWERFATGEDAPRHPLAMLAYMTLRAYSRTRGPTMRLSPLQFQRVLEWTLRQEPLLQNLHYRAMRHEVPAGMQNLITDLMEVMLRLVLTGVDRTRLRCVMGAECRISRAGQARCAHMARLWEEA